MGKATLRITIHAYWKYPEINIKIEFLKQPVPSSTITKNVHKMHSTSVMKRDFLRIPHRSRVHLTDYRKRNIVNEELFDKIYRQYYKIIYNYISFCINNHHDSEDLTSSVFENAIHKFHTFKPELSPVEAWLIGIAKNIVTDYWRSKKYKLFVPIDNIIHLVSRNRQPEEVLVMNEENKILIQAMSLLKDSERQLLSMKFASDLKNCEIAKILGISESNAGVMIYRAVQKLRKILKHGE